ncbi:MAG: hypothetical protein ACRC1M_03360, partial [Methanobacteriaceae archaeon]
TYMREFEKNGGGTLILKKGTYTIPAVIPVPSNVNIILEDGVLIKKGSKTGTSNVRVSTAIFKLVKPNKLQKNRAYGKYDGTKNVNFIGRGSATIDLRYKLNNIAISCGHNKNIKIQGITFKNMYSGHFIELAGTYNTKISNCKFLNAKNYVKGEKEAINIDTPDGNTKGFNNIWSKLDKTPNKYVTIENNVFNNLDRAIGTHKYSQVANKGKYVANKGQVYHTNIKIKNNKIIKTNLDAIRPLNWKDSEITNNDIGNVKRKEKGYIGILATGVNIKIEKNYFYNMIRAVHFNVVKNTGTGSMYTPTYNTLTKQNKIDLGNNLCELVNEPYARIDKNIYKYYWNPEIIYMINI